MNRFLTIPFLLSFFLLSGCSLENCPDNINLLPMFGEKKKCTEQIESDKKFLSACDKEFKSRQEAANYHIARAWDYFNANHQDSSMMRFNQAWMLDSTNAEIYWGFGNLIGKQQKFAESILYFEKSLKLDSKNPIVWQGLAFSYGNLFYESKEIRNLTKSIECSMQSLKIDSQNATTLAQLAASYSFFTQKDSALKYLALADKIDPSKINPGVRQILKR